MIQYRVDTNAAGQIGGEQTFRIQLTFDLQQVLVAGIDAVKLIGPQDLVLGEVNLSAAAGGCIDYFRFDSYN